MKIAIISDIHANIFALDAVYSDFESIGIHSVLVAGDIIGYYFWPNEVIERLINDSRVIAIRGNHEDILESCIADTAYAEKVEAKYGSGHRCCLETVGPEGLEWLRELPASRAVEFASRSFFMSHGSLNSTDTYIYPDCAAEVLAANFSSADVTIFGHTHYPFIHCHGERYMINPGSVGQPRDKGGIASYAVVNTDNMTIQPRRVAFDIAPIIAESQKRNPSLEYLWKIMQR